MARGRRIALATAATALALGTLVAAGCGERRLRRGARAPAAAGRASRARSPAPARAPRRPRSRPGSPASRRRTPAPPISYDPVGSGGGREQFIAGGVAFGGSDSALADTGADRRPGALRRRGQPGRDPGLRLPDRGRLQPARRRRACSSSPDTLAKIFNHEITKWNDPAIAADNPDATLPDTDITTVNRSDESGTTENFTDYLAAVAPTSGPTRPTDTWPVKGGESAQGTSGVVDADQRGEGTIGYADASQAGDLGMATLKVGDDFVAADAPRPRPRSSTSRRGRHDPAPYVFTYDLKRDTTSQGVYPIVLVSYEMACTTYDDADTARARQGAT